MYEWLQSNEGVLRLSGFLGGFVLFAFLETLWPRRERELGRVFHWVQNLGLVVINTLVLRLVFPVLAVPVAWMAAEQGWGVFNQWQLSLWLEILITVVLLDMAIYWQHRLFHEIPMFWRLHRMHHSDIDLDVSSGLRFHPLEIVLSMLIKMALVVVLGADAVAVIVFELILNVSAMFNHANYALPQGLDRIMRKMIVTPDMHRIHHAEYSQEFNSNYGFFFSIWDYVFHSYTDQPRDGHEAMRVGLDKFRTRSEQAIPALMLQPFQQVANREGNH